MNLYLGFDISISSTSICIKYGQQCEYLLLVSKRSFSKAKEIDLQDIIDKHENIKLLSNVSNVSIKWMDRIPISRKDSVNDYNKNSIKDSIAYSELLVNFLIKHINKKYSDIKHQNIITAIEHYSIGSYTNNLISTVELTTLIKKMLIDKLYKGNISNINVVPGPTVKKLAGGGSFDKYQMLFSFLTHYQDKSDSLYSVVAKNISAFTCGRKKKGKPYTEVLSPLDDIIDSYFIAEWLETLKD